MNDDENDEYAIDSGEDFPMPPFLGRGAKYPFEKLEVGDTFFAKAQPQFRLSAAAYRWAKKLDRKFTVRKVEGGTRVWRTK